MKRGPKLWLSSIGLVASLALVAAGSAIYADKRLRYRLTLEVDTPDGVRSGASVIEVTIERNVPFWGDNGIHYHVRGEAPAVELPDGQLLLALLKDAMNVSLPELAALHGTTVPPLSRRYQYPAGSGWGELKRRRPVIDVNLADAYGNLALHFPDLVVVDPSKPLSIRAVDPLASENVLGPGLSLRRMLVSIVDAPVDYSLERRLPWLEQVSPRLDEQASRTGKLYHALTPSRFLARRR